jgi:hypothetical protein
MVIQTMDNPKTCSKGCSFPASVYLYAYELKEKTMSAPSVTATTNTKPTTTTNNNKQQKTYPLFGNI